MDQLIFWKTCCERGISICEIPKPFKEEVNCWLVVKHATFKDRKTWTSSHTFESFAELQQDVQAYIDNNTEPRSKRE